MTIMSKRFFSYITFAFALAVVLFFLHQYLLNLLNIQVSLPLFSMYIFHLASFLVISLGVEWLSKKMPTQVGYAYLASVFIKIGLFVLIFQSAIFGDEELSMASRLSIIFPLFIFLILEATFAGRLMNLNN